MWCNKEGLYVIFSADGTFKIEFYKDGGNITPLLTKCIEWLRFSWTIEYEKKPQKKLRFGSALWDAARYNTHRFRKRAKWQKEGFPNDEESEKHDAQFTADSQDPGVLPG